MQYKPKNLGIDEPHQSGIKEATKVPLIRTTLTSLPIELFLDILFSLGSYKDLYAFINTTTACYNAFSLYPDMILTQIGKNILGDSWEEATTVLVWQRHCSHPGAKPNYSAVKKDLEAKFVLHRKDIPFLVANHRFFESCKRHFANRASSNNDLFSSRTSVDVLPMKSFYQMWLLHLRFRYEEIETFASLVPFTREHYQDLRLVSDIMFCNLQHCTNFVVSPLPGSHKYSKEPENLLYRTLFGIWRPLAENAPKNFINDNPLLYLKMVCHMASRIAGDGLITSPQGYGSRWTTSEVHWFRTRFREAMGIFGVEYPSKSVSAMVRDYNLSPEFVG